MSTILSRISTVIKEWFYVKDKSPRALNDEDFNSIKSKQEKEVNKILDKIYKKGEKSLTQKERDFLNTYSKK
jgi:folylpolyglutamate synthase/dihydropteroate synthase